ncbi:MAG: phosphoglucomutase, partial [Staphylothermus sp.]|nr:phosphoglucomutase [Staphylothermus sp.]
MGYKIINDRITGVPNLEFTPEDASNLGAIIGSWYGVNSIVVSGRDYNPSSRMLKRAFISGLMSVGVEVMDFHESVAGEIAYSIKRFGARGGFIVVNNSILTDHVMFKIFTNPGIELVGDKLTNILNKKEIKRVDPHNTGWVSYAEYIHRLYISALSSFIAYDRIMEKKFKVVVDVNHGPADKIIPELFSHLGIDFILINASKPTKKEQYTYPYINNIREISNIVRSTDADMGLIFNNDASSYLLLDENGKPLLPEEVLLLY